jgi:hypothetical protein
VTIRRRIGYSDGLGCARVSRRPEFREEQAGCAAIRTDAGVNHAKGQDLAVLPFLPTKILPIIR